MSGMMTVPARSYKVSPRYRLIDSISVYERELRRKSGRLRDAVNSCHDMTERLAEKSMVCDRLSERAKSLSEENASLRKRLSEAEERCFRLSDENKTLNYLVDEASLDIDRLLDKSERLSGKVSKLMAVNETLGRKRQDTPSDRCRDVILGMDEFPRNMNGLIRFCDDVFGDRIKFSEDCYKYDKDSRTDVNESWRLIRSLADTGYEVFIENRGGDDMLTEFGNRTGFRFALTESGRLKKNPELVDKRTFDFDDGRFRCFWHIGRNSHTPYDRTLRCYFYPDSSIRKIRVGYVGLHL